MKKLSKKHPLRLAWDAWHSGRTEGIGSLYLSALLSTPDTAEAQQMLGYLALELDDTDTAVLALGKCVMIEPGIAESHMLHGVALRRKGEGEAAVIAFRKALELRAEWPDAINNLSVTLEELGRLAEAHEWVLRGLEFAPDDVDLRNQCGCILCAQGRHQAAIAEYKHALEIDPDFEPARLNLEDAQREVRAA